MGHERTVEAHGWPGVVSTPGGSRKRRRSRCTTDWAGVDAPVVQLVVMAVADSAERKDLFIDFDTGNLAGRSHPSLPPLQVNGLR